MKISEIPTQETESSFIARKRIEEKAAQRPQTSSLPVMTPWSDYVHDSIDSTSQIAASDSTTRPPSFQTLHTPQNDPLLKKLDKVSQTPPSDMKPFDVLYFEIMKTLESASAGAMKSREQLLTLHKDWRISLEQELLNTSEKARTSQDSAHFMTRIGHAMGSVGVFGSGLVACFMGTVTLPTLAAAAISGLFFIDSIFDDTAKKSIAGFLAQGQKEAAKEWLQRIQLFTSAISMFLQFTTTGLKAIQIAALASQAALEGIKTGSEKSRDDSKAHLLEIDDSCTLSKNASDEILQKWEQIMDTVLENYQLMHALHVARAETYQAFVRTIK